ncbi:MAG: ABC transporter permease [Syntrophobacteraceae bacterium]|nr:ABC transporter permease [Syntrophobacteraceae bacterium]
MKSFRIVIAALGGVLILVIVAPLAKVIVSSAPSLLRSTACDPEVLHSIFLTLRAALWATLGCLLLGVPLAYALARWDFPGGSLVQGIVDLPVMIPHTAAGVALLMVYGREFWVGKAFALVGITFTGTVAGISLAMAFVSLPFLVNAARDGFLAVDPRLECVARTLGASPWQTFFKVSLLLSWRSILSGATLMWARGIAEFGAVVMLTYHPMVAPILIWERFENFGLRYATPVSAILILLCLVIFSGLRWLAAQKEDR